ncbi:hypothetical protein M0R45_028837 [Rubus argutus]|uniref:Uncharacterized protein n=1 Tax=Rubus argutus TaxID=59490 RepID=A0AAW1W9V3_RUBAR
MSTAQIWRRTGSSLVNSKVAGLKATPGWAHGNRASTGSSELGTVMRRGQSWNRRTRAEKLDGAEEMRPGRVKLSQSSSWEQLGLVIFE